MDLTGNCSEVSFIACRCYLYCQSHVSYERVKSDFVTPGALMLLDVGCGLWRGMYSTGGIKAMLKYPGRLRGR